MKFYTYSSYDIPDGFAFYFWGDIKRTVNEGKTIIFYEDENESNGLRVPVLSG